MAVCLTGNTIENLTLLSAITPNTLFAVYEGSDTYKVPYSNFDYDIILTAITYNNANTFTFRDNKNNNRVSVSFNTLTGLTATTISATTYLNYPTNKIDVSGSTLYSTNPSTSGFNTTHSILIGCNAGVASPATTSINIMIGCFAGSGSSSVNCSNYFGTFAGYSSSCSDWSNFIGYSAGCCAVRTGNTFRSNFIGVCAGLDAGGFSSIAIGECSGWKNTIFPTISDFVTAIGSCAGLAPRANHTGANYIGYNAGGTGQQCGRESQMIGTGVGNGVGFHPFSVYIGTNAACGSNSNCCSVNIGTLAGALNGSSPFSTSIGFCSHYCNVFPLYSVSLGECAGSCVGGNYINTIGTKAGFFGSSSESTFIGDESGYQFPTANSNSNSNFIGTRAGKLGLGAISNFIGYEAGFSSTSAAGSNFFGDSAGYKTNSNCSNFIGYYAGYSASTSSFSNLIGYQTGYEFTNNKLGTNNIIIGTNITLPSGCTNSLNIGSVLFGTNTNSDASGNPKTGTTSNGRIGIGVVQPTSTLDVSGFTGYNQIRIRESFIPTGSTDSRGNTGDVSWSDNYFYLKNSTGWTRTQLTSFP